MIWNKKILSIELLATVTAVFLVSTSRVVGYARYLTLMILNTDNLSFILV